MPLLERGQWHKLRRLSLHKASLTAKIANDFFRKHQALECLCLYADVPLNSLPRLRSVHLVGTSPEVVFGVASNLEYLSVTISPNWSAFPYKFDDLGRILASTVHLRSLVVRNAVYDRDMFATISSVGPHIERLALRWYTFSSYIRQAMEQNVRGSHSH